MFDKLKKAGKKLADGAQDAVEEFKDKDCDWNKKVDEVHTECGESIVYGFTSNTLNYCPFCGKKIEWQEQEQTK